MGAGNYRPITRATTMQGQPPLLQELYYGRDAENFYLRIDFCKQPPALPDKSTLRLGIQTADHSTGVLVTFSQPSPEGKISCSLRLEQESAASGPLGETGLNQAALGHAVMGRILEIKLGLGVLGINPDLPFEFQTSLWQESLPLESLPLDGWLSVPVPSSA
jgi:hypothetical protein